MTIDPFIIFIKALFPSRNIPCTKVVIFLLIREIQLPYSYLSSAAFYIFHVPKAPSFSLFLMHSSFHLNIAPEDWRQFSETR